MIAPPQTRSSAHLPSRHYRQATRVDPMEVLKSD